jgi:hypothetical protein
MAVSRAVGRKVGARIGPVISDEGRARRIELSALRLRTRLTAAPLSFPIVPRVDRPLPALDEQAADQDADSRAGHARIR